MKKIKRLCLTFTALAASFVFLSFACNAAGRRDSAYTAFADTGTAVNIPENSLKVVEAMQDVFRSISAGVLPSVVELDVKEKVTVPANPFEGLPFFFFGQPQGDGAPREREQQGLGSGVIVRRDGKTYYALTNNHVAGTATEISVKFADGRVMNGKLVGADKRRDIALVSFQSDDPNIPLAVLGDSDTVRQGDICFAMGTPLGFDSSVTQGIISAIGRSGTNVDNISDFIQTDAAINQGNSGGPLVNIYGEVIGINTWIASQSGGSVGLGFTIPINNVKKAIGDFIASGKVTYGWLGAALVGITDEYKAELGVGKADGAFVAQVYVGSPGQKGGMQAGDFVTALNDKSVKSVDQLVRQVGDLPVGQKAMFDMIRGGKTITVNATIEARDEGVTADGTNLWPGFIPAPITESVRKELKIENNVRGVVVTGVTPKSAAAAIRLQNNDVITAVNDVKVANLKDFYATLDRTGKKEIWFDVYSEGHTVSTGRYKID
jgi:Do/DeqQ family serine protease